MKNYDLSRFYSDIIEPTINTKTEANELITWSLCSRDFKAATGKDISSNYIVTEDDFKKVLSYLKVKKLTKTKLKYELEDIPSIIMCKKYTTDYMPDAPFNATQKRVQKLKYIKHRYDEKIEELNSINSVVQTYNSKTDEEKEEFKKLVKVLVSRNAHINTKIAGNKDKLTIYQNR